MTTLRFRSVLLLVVLPLVVGVVGATVAAIVQVIDASARTELNARLGRGVTVFRDLVALRRSLYRTEARTVADSPRLRAVVATEDIDTETVVGVATDESNTLDADLFAVANARGRFLATLPASAERTLGGSAGLVPRALARDEASAVLTDGEHAYQVEARSIRFGVEVAGAIVVGHALDDALVRTVERHSGDRVVLLLGRRVIGTTFPAPMRTGLGASLEQLDLDARREIEVGGSRYIAVATRVPGGADDAALRCVVLSSLDEALAPSAKLKQVVYTVAAAALLIALLAVLYLARRLSRPIDQLAEWSRRVAAGHLAARVVPSGPHETRTLGVALNAMAAELESSRTELVAKERLEQEMEIASRLQLGILPRGLDAPGLEISAKMVPASEVGGDYYDLLAADGTAWIGIGDVSGHGLPAGVVMMMAQTAVSALVHESPKTPPSQMIAKLNALFFENVKLRLGNAEHMTLCLLRHEGDGAFRFAGAHEPLVVWRADKKTCDVIEAEGAWLGIVADVTGENADARVELGPDDVMVLHTDGVTEGKDADGVRLGVAGLVKMIDGILRAGMPAADIRDQLVAAVGAREPVREDDVTFVVVRRSRRS